MKQFITRCNQHAHSIYSNRHIIRSLVTKSLFGRYKNSTLGFAWHFVNPMVMMVVYFIVYSGGIRSSSIDNYWIYLASGLFPFHFMLTNLVAGSGCIVNNSGLVKKIYFPREIIVMSQVISTMITCLIGYSLILIMILITGQTTNLVTILLTIPIFGIMFIFVLGYTLLFSSVTVYKRDIQYLLSSLSMIFYFLTPMYFVATNIDGILGKLIWFNPITYFIEIFHSLIYYGEIPESNIIIIAIVESLLAIVCGSILFNKVKGGFAERL